MSDVLKCLCWASAMLFIAAGSRFGFMDHGAATTLLYVQPDLDILSLRGSPLAFCGRRA